MPRTKNKNQGFTLIELIIVVAIIGLLAAALFVAIDPAKRIGDARDAQRWSDVTAVLNAVLTYTADAGGLPTAISQLTQDVEYSLSTSHGCTKGLETLTDIGATTLESNIVPTYITTLPYDPTYSGATSTGYYIIKRAGNRIHVGACESYQTGSIEVSR